MRELQTAGFEIRGEQLKTTPRGYDADHPRIDLLRYKSMALGRSYGFENLTLPTCSTGSATTGARCARSSSGSRGSTSSADELARARHASDDRRQRRTARPATSRRARLVPVAGQLRYSGLRTVAIVRSTSQCAAIETSLPSSLTR